MRPHSYHVERYKFNVHQPLNSFQLLNCTGKYLAKLECGNFRLSSILVAAAGRFRVCRLRERNTEGLSNKWQQIRLEDGRSDIRDFLKFVNNGVDKFDELYPTAEREKDK
jgi:hypothetical protein